MRIAPLGRGKNVGRLRRPARESGDDAWRAGRHADERADNVVPPPAPRAATAIAWAWLWIVFANVTGLAAEPVTIRWLPEAAPTAVEVAGVSTDALAAKPESVLVVFAEQGSGNTMPPMSGTWSVVGNRLRFVPRFPLTRGVRYRAEYRPADAAPVVSRFELPVDESPLRTAVTQVFPSAEVLPENQLKFYVHFSAPMSRGGIYQNIRLLDAHGKPLELPFLELDEELWDPSMTRLTLLIDPGRIKRGVKPLEDIGPVFELGRSYVLTVAATCRDAEGRPLRDVFEKTFRVAAADRTPPEPARWKIHAPAAGTRAALLVDFDEPMDHALALRLIRVAAPGGGAAMLDGDPALGAEERQWSFVPDRPWQRGSHRLIVATTIEDLAGNNIGKTFDVDLFENVQRRVETRNVSVAFEVK